MNAIDDKNAIIFALLVIALCLVWIEPAKEAAAIINNIISGLLGMAVGKSVAK